LPTVGRIVAEVCITARKWSVPARWACLSVVSARMLSQHFRSAHRDLITLRRRGRQMWSRTVVSGDVRQDPAADSGPQRHTAGQAWTPPLTT